MIRYTDMINTIFKFEKERGISENDRYTKYDDGIKAAVAKTNDNNKIIEKYHEIIDIYENEEQQAEEEARLAAIEKEKLRGTIENHKIEASEQENLSKEMLNNKPDEIEANPENKNIDRIRENEKPRVEEKVKKRMFLLKSTEEETDIIAKTKIVIVKCLSDENYDKAVYSIKNINEAVESYMSLKECKKMIGFEYHDDIYIVAGQESDNDKLEVYVTEEDRKTFGDELNKISLFYVNNIVSMIKKKEEEYEMAIICQDNKEYTDEDFNMLLKDISSYECIFGKEYNGKDFRKADFKNLLFVECNFKNNLFVDSKYMNTLFYKCNFENDVFARTDVTNQNFIMCQGNYYDSKGHNVMFNID